MIGQKQIVFEGDFSIGMPTDDFINEEIVPFKQVTQSIGKRIFSGKCKLVGQVKNTVEAIKKRISRDLDSSTSQDVRQFLETIFWTPEFSEVLNNSVDSVIKKNKESGARQASVEIKISCAVENQMPVIKIKDNGSGRSDLDPKEKRRVEIKNIPKSDKQSSFSESGKYCIGGTGAGLGAFMWTVKNKIGEFSLTMKNRISPEENQIKGMTVEIRPFQYMEEKSPSDYSSEYEDTEKFSFKEDE